MSRGLSLSFALLMTLAACGGVAEPEPAPTSIPVPTPATSPAPTASQPPPVDTKPVWKGFSATGEHGDLAAMVHGPLDVYAVPGDSEPIRTLEASTILGTVTVLGVVDEPEGDWVEVMLPGRPNGSTGWARTAELSLYVADGRIVVDLGERELVYLVDGIEVLRTEVGIGSEFNETPPGQYFVTDVVTLKDPNSTWGPHALGLSARSDTITSFNGGDGIIGIHGTNNPGSVGADISLGCIRLSNEMITKLHSMVAIGTRVDINA